VAHDYCVGWPCGAHGAFWPHAWVGFCLAVNTLGGSTTRAEVE
jgi:hypothetical protein